MKNYGAMRFVAGLLKLIGWLIIAAGALVIIVGFNVSTDMPYLDKTMSLVAPIVAGGFIALLGIFTIASGEMISAVADIAVNTALLRSIAANSEKTVGFFEHISAKSNVPPEPAPTTAPTPTIS